MFCPKCGAENQEDIAYCRNCGEDLKIISQAMKKHLPIALMSKLDTAIEKKSERFRRDAILWAVGGAILLISSVFIKWSDSVGLIFLGLILFLFGVRGFLTYRRSLENPEGADFLDCEKISPLGLSQIEILPNQSTSIFCPKCGTQNLENVLYCCACGINLDFNVPPQGMEKYLPASFIKGLDVRIARNNEEENFSAVIFRLYLIFFSFGVLLLGIISGLSGNWGQMIYRFLLASYFFIVGIWEIVAYWRSLELAQQTTGVFRFFMTEIPKKTFEENDLSIQANILLVGLYSLVSIIFLYSGNLEIGLFFGLFIFFVLFVWIIKVVQNLGYREDKEYSIETSELTTNELPPPDTLSLESMLLNITEPTTKHLEPSVKQVEKIKVKL